MKYSPRLSNLIIFLGVITMACSKSDPKPLGAQVNAALLAGDKNKSKSWKLVSGQASSNGSLVTVMFPPCLLDNIYTFTNNDAQSYLSAEGPTKCYSADPDTVESGTWSFTLDGQILNVETNSTPSQNGLFSVLPFPAVIQKIDASNLIVQINFTVGTNKYLYLLTFAAI